MLPRDELVGATIEEWIVAYDECTNPLLDKARKGSVDLAFGAGAHNADLLPDSAAGRLKAPRRVSARIGLVGLTSRAITVAAGNNSCSNCNCFAPISTHRLFRAPSRGPRFHPAWAKSSSGLGRKHQDDPINAGVTVAF